MMLCAWAMCITCISSQIFFLACCLMWIIVKDRDLKETEGSKIYRSKFYEDKQLIKESNPSHEFMGKNVQFMSY